ncbi:hypothetical protein [uncultured Nocardioides sp.]|uniref:hypothetical protein n=1 Tax=uncultured Nocardioides sp. TaxID=198441 RepID=UPI0025D7B2C5|nr:hypothetical protein [uncultured Nocardioides sp.]
MPSRSTTRRRAAAISFRRWSWSMMRRGPDRQLHGRLERLAGWLDRRSSGAGLWAVAIVGVLLAGDAASALFP